MSENAVVISKERYEHLTKCARFSDALIWAMWYDGLEDNINAMIEYIANKKDERGIVFHPSHSHNRSACVTSDDAVESRPPAVLWECLVLAFGNYGTSPRSGWIERPDEAVSFLKSLRRDTYGFDHHHEGDGPPIWEVSDEEYAQSAAEWELQQLGGGA